MSCSHFLRLEIFFLIFQNQSAAGDVIKQIRKKKALPVFIYHDEQAHLQFLVVVFFF